MLIRLQKILSGAGVASRRAAERLMTEGRVTVNGQTVRELGTRADPDQDDIRVDGSAIRRATRRLYFVLNKPRGYVTTRSDPEGRPTVLDLIPRLHDYVYPVGRLDYDSEGLLILTNDGELAAALTHPSHEVAREYHARVRGVPDDARARPPRARRRARRPEDRASRGGAGLGRPRPARRPGTDVHHPARGTDAPGEADVRGGGLPGRPAPARSLRPARRRRAEAGHEPATDGGRGRCAPAGRRDWSALTKPVGALRVSVPTTSSAMTRQLRHIVSPTDIVSSD